MKRVLVVDDEADFLTAITALLTPYGFTVDTVSSQDDIYKSILIFQPQVILLDIHLNGADGRNICRGLKNHFKTNKIPIIFCSGDIKLYEGFEDYRADEFAQKPVNIAHLVERLDHYCGSAPAMVS